MSIYANYENCPKAEKGENCLYGFCLKISPSKILLKCGAEGTPCPGFVDRKKKGLGEIAVISEKTGSPVE